MRNGPLTTVDLTRPIADRDYWCECGSPERPEFHKIKKGDVYVRMIYDKVATREKFLTIHVCVPCWTHMDKND